jgi:hypothetical protein
MDTNSKWPVDGAYELLKGMIDELRHQVGRLQSALARRDDYFAGEMEATYRSR